MPPPQNLWVETAVGPAGFEFRRLLGGTEELAWGRPSALGKVVILDRYWWSTCVYGRAAGVSHDVLSKLIQLENLIWKTFLPTILQHRIRTSMMEPEYELWLANPAASTVFAKDQPGFVAELEHLTSLCQLVFGGDRELPENLDVVLFVLGLLCFEDFREILLLAANGYGTGAIKILRGMYERAVTARYLYLHPQEVQAFIDYHWVAQHKLTEAVIRTFGTDPKLLPQAKLNKVRQNYETVRDRFLVPLCKVCNTTRVNHSWSTLDFVSMASCTGELADLLPSAYYIPLQETHTSIFAMSARFRDEGGGSWILNEAVQEQRSSSAISSAHLILLNIVDLEASHFRADSVSERLKSSQEAWYQIWSKTKPSS